MLKLWRKVSRFVARCVLTLVLLMGPFLTDAQCGNMGTSVAVDGAGNIYVTGTITRWADFDPGLAAVWCGVSNPVEYPGGETWSMGYLAKYGSDRSLQWFVRLTGNASQWLNDVAVGSDGSVYVVGFSQYATSFGNTALDPLVMSAFLAKVDPSTGSVDWCTQLNNTELAATGSLGENIALETGNDGTTTGVVISGWFRPANPNFGDAPFIARYDLVGILDWAEGLGATGSASISDLTADASGVYATGSFRKTLDFGLDAGNVLLTMTAADEWISDGFLVKWSNSVNGPVWQWGEQYVGVSLAAVASDGNHVYVSAGDNAQDNGITSGLEFIAKLDIAGDPVWREPWPNGIAYDIAARGGNLYLTGTFAGTVDFDLGASTQALTANGRDIFIWKMTDDGEYLWAGQMGGPSIGMLPNDRGAGIAVDAGGSVITTGTFLGRPADFDPSAGTASLIRFGRGDAFVSKVGPTMTHQWAFQIGSLDQFADNGQNENGISYSESGSGWKSVNSTGYMNDYRTHAKGTGANKARWTVSNLPNGQYEVFAMWKPNSKNATNATYKVNGAATPPVNQRVTPDSIHLNTTIESGVTSHWKSLGRFSAVNGTITVELSDAANGIVVADAIRVLIYQPRWASYQLTRGHKHPCGYGAPAITRRAKLVQMASLFRYELGLTASSRVAEGTMRTPTNVVL